MPGTSSLDETGIKGHDDEVVTASQWHSADGLTNTTTGTGWPLEDTLFPLIIQLIMHN